MKLKKCPFCGGKGELWNNKLTYRLYGVICEECDCMTPYFTTREEAIEAWNRRKPLEDIVEQLEQLQDIERLTGRGYCPEIDEEDSDRSCLTSELGCGYCAFEKAIEIVKSGGGDILLGLFIAIMRNPWRCKMGRLTKAELTTAIDIFSHPQSGDESDIFAAYTTARVAMKELKQYKDLEEAGRLIEVIRCSECEHYDTDGCADGCGWCDYWDIGRFTDGYCDKAKLKELKE